MNRYSVVELRSVLPTLLFSCAISINLQVLSTSLYFFSFPICLHGMLMVIKLIVYSIDYPGSERDSNWEYHSETDVILDKTFVPCFYERMSMSFLLGYPCCVKGGNFGLFFGIAVWKFKYGKKSMWVVYIWFGLFSMSFKLLIVYFLTLQRLKR